MLRVSVGIGVIAWVVVTLFMAIVPGPWKSADPYELAWNISVYPFLISLGVGAMFYIKFNWPALQASLEKERLEQARLKHQAKHLDDQPAKQTGPIVEQPNSGARYSKEHSAYYAGLFRYARDAGGLTFRQIQPYFGANRAAALETWRKVLYPLSRQGILEPIEEGKPTAFRADWDMDKAIAWFEAGHTLRPEITPPYPPPDPFESLKQGTGETRE